MRNFVTTLGSESIRNLLDEDIFNKVASLEAGKSFGEIALIKSKPRQARIICEENWEFATLSKDDFSRILAKVEVKLANDNIDFFLNIPLFSSWSRNLIHKLLYRIDKKKFQRDQYVIKEGEPIQEVYIIKEGEFEVTSKIPDNKNENLKLTEKLQDRNYLKKFLSPK